MPMTGFVCQDTYLSKLAKLSDQEVGRLMRALMKYHACGEEPELAGRESVAFDFIRDDIDRAEAAYQAKCDKNRANRTSDNGRERPLTTVNDREPEPTNAPKIKEKEKYKEKEINTERAREAKKAEEERFDRFWTAYPRKTAKQDAMKAFARLNPDDALLDTILTALEKHKKSDQWTRDGGQYIPHPATWLIGKRWTDEMTEAQPRAAKTVAAQQYHQREYEDRPAEEMPNWLKESLAADAQEASA